MGKEIISTEQMIKVLDTCYDKAINGLPGTKTCVELGEYYLAKYKTKESAAEKLIKNQVSKCTTSGFITSLGGLITLPVALPANITSVIYVQLRMIAALAVIAGYDVGTDEVQTLSYVCLARTSLVDAAGAVGVKFTEKLSLALIKKIPGKVLTKINKAVSFRLVTKFGTTGLINLGKTVPVVSGFVGGGFDYFNTKGIAKQAYKTFILDEIV